MRRLPCYSFRDPAYAHIDFGYFVPCPETYDTVRCEFEYFLEGLDCFFRLWPKDTVHCDFRYERVGVGNDVQLLLHLADFVAGTAYFQIVSGPGGRHAGNHFTGIDKNGIPVIIPEYFNRRIAAVAKRL